MRFMDTSESCSYWKLGSSNRGVCMLVGRSRFGFRTGREPEEVLAEKLPRHVGHSQGVIGKSVCLSGLLAL